ncbi:hypothetical protein AG1IA_03118 [Rhizoctonia solani AG-1 IA]|uniref:Uncharacterized protein n=1 Tax=Thanatephorus cucumeris (strain AG1-IA) TaxID=983506 RepID=L8X1H1_THACA|nr:hypothetical protein AG1IA_03118 [Rhizoctonia solani AG-1 IA]
MARRSASAWSVALLAAMKRRRLIAEIYSSRSNGCWSSTIMFLLTGFWVSAEAEGPAPLTTPSISSWYSEYNPSIAILPS